MESKNGGFVADDHGMHSPSQVPGMINEIDQIHKTGFYKPNIWKYDRIEALTIDHDQDEGYETMLGKLIEQVKCLLSNTVDTWEKLELVDNMEKLGLAYLFEHEIEKVLDTLVSNTSINLKGEKNLYNTALLFKLLREHGHHVSQDMFAGLLDISTHSDVKPMLKLFEASHLAFEGENILDEANAISRNNLESIGTYLDDASPAIISRILKDPYNIWYNVKTQIQFHGKNSNSNFHLLNLARYNFNMIQATHQKEVKELLRWWRALDLKRSVPFVRNRIMESFVCAVGIVCEPKYGSLRNWLTKSISLIIVLDDVYDASGGTLEELEIFTNAVKRWDDKDTQTLPECMKFCLRILYDTIKDIASQIQVEYGWNFVSSFLHEAWTNFCRAMLKEARWFNMKYTPSLKEHTDNGRTSSSGPLLSLHIFFALVPKTEQHEVINLLKCTEDHQQNVALIFRLCNDLGNHANSSILIRLLSRGWRRLINSAITKATKDVDYPMKNPFSWISRC